MIDLRTVAPANGFRKVLMDPPWKFISWTKGKNLPSRGPDPYPTMTFAEMAALPVPEILARDSAVFMWVVDTHLDQAIDLGRAYGLTYKTIVLIWDKGRMSFGKWSRKEAEVCLLFTRGKIGRDADAGGVRQIIREKPRQHSRKPEGQYVRIEKLIAGGPSLEMFCRQKRPDWANWGNDVDRF